MNPSITSNPLFPFLTNLLLRMLAPSVWGRNPVEANLGAPLRLPAPTIRFCNIDTQVGLEVEIKPNGENIGRQQYVVGAELTTFEQVGTHA
jgi:hypothetical protein